MKKYVIEKTLTDIKDGYMHCKGHKELYICKVNHTIAARTFFKDPAFWSEYLYTSKKRAERSMKIIQENIQKEPWAPLLNECCDVSFRIVEIEAK